MRKAVIVAARRTAVVPRNGAFKHLQADELAAPVLQAVLLDAGITASSVDRVILGNALYGGGNPARLAALRAGLPESVPAMTIDTQCCSGLDAILLAAHLVEVGAADCVLAGGAESFSGSAIRMRRPNAPEEEPIAYDRPPFSPWPDRDLDLTEAAASLALVRGYTRDSQAVYAAESHRKALSHAQSGGFQAEIVPLAGVGSSGDAFTRALTIKAALRAPVLAGDAETGVTAATTAVEADAAAVVLVMSPAAARRRGLSKGLQILGGASRGGDPAEPALVPVQTITELTTRLDIDLPALPVVELMEAYASQAMATVSDLQLDQGCVNIQGGALARGHPIGASGAILAVRLFHLLSEAAPGSRGLAAIAAAGGLATALAVTAL